MLMDCTESVEVKHDSSTHTTNNDVQLEDNNNIVENWDDLRAGEQERLGLGP